MKRIGIGTQFRWNHADSNPLWEVKKARGRGTWDCEVVESPDWLGTCKTFSTEEIRASLAQDAFWKKSADSSERFFQSLTPGSVVHYKNGFNAFVRCQVTADHQLLPVALVGQWRDYDLPKRQLDGSIYLGYHAQQIKDGKVFKPHASNVWEHQRQERDIDPRPLPVISLEVPEMTEADQVMARKYKTLDVIRQLVRSNDDPDATFEAIRGLIG